MTHKKFLSEKKTSNQNISISPALKEWIKRYVNVKRKEHPDDERYKSVSSFYCHVMESVLEMFEKGKSLDDFHGELDIESREFLEKTSFLTSIPGFENSIVPNRYVMGDLDALTGYLLKFRKAYLNSSDGSDRISGFKEYFDRIKPIFTEDTFEYLNLDLIRGKDRTKVHGILETKGKYKNIHYEIMKRNLMILGILGAKVKNLIYSPKEIYSRIDMVSTELLNYDKLLLKQRKKLIKQNLEFLINYSRVIKDKDYHLWMKMAEDNEHLVSFKNIMAFERWIQLIEGDLRKYGDKEEFLLNILMAFERIHWIRILNENTLSFEVELSIENNPKEREFLLNYLSSHSKVILDDGKYYLEKK